MKKILFTPIVFILSLTSFAQLNNSWIDYSKTYYKFKIGANGLCRISQPSLLAIGLGSANAQNFQLWRNGKEVRLYTSIPSGVFGTNDFIEFWGEMNDGRADKNLYLDTAYQLNNTYSLFTDTATYYLTINTTSNNLRYTAAANPVAGNILPAEAYFMRKIEKAFKDRINPGKALSPGTNVYSASFDKGEGWTSGDIYTGSPAAITFNNINKYAAGPANGVTFTVSAFGNSALYSRDLFAQINGTSVLPSSSPLAQMDTYRKDTITNLPLSLLTSASTININVGCQNSNNPANDRIVVANVSITYPATFNFNNEKNFYFELPNSSSGNYLEISNFNNNGQAPILYDINNGLRYLGDISVAGLVRFVLPASADAVRKFNLISQDATNISNPATFTNKTFLNLTNNANQADYIIISNPLLYDNGSGVNYVEQYRQYRSSLAGGGFTAKIYDIAELTEQFGFGIKNHPAAVRDFIRYANQQFSAKPKFVFLIGRAVNYIDYKNNETSPFADKLNLVPTFGWPASDALLVSNPGSLVPLVPVGRIGAVTGNEVSNYLEKMKQYELAQKSPSQTIADKGWMKNIVHIAGGADDAESNLFVNYVNQYKPIAEDTLFGAHVETFVKSSTSATQEISSTRIDQLFKEGISFITYFGHSSASVLAFNLDDPSTYQNQGKYPFINVSGCDAGDYYTFNPNRIANNYYSISENYTFANQKGSIGFFADTHFGIGDYLNFYDNAFYKEFCKNNYGGAVGDQIKKVIQNLGTVVPDFYTRIHLEELALQGDPALKINAFAKPDYVVEDQTVKVSPSIVSIADNNFNVDIKMYNIGKTINDSIRVTVKRTLPDNSIKTVLDKKIVAIKYIDSLSLIVPINPLTDKGLNKITVVLDADNKIDELSELNNTITKEFYIYEDELTPVYPYNYSIINKQNITFTASTANPLVLQKQYVMELDTTELFNSSFKKTYTASGNGGVIEFKPANLSFTDSTVYYWRTSIVPAGGSTTVIWNTSSFVYLANSTDGWNQSHLYQHFKSNYVNIKLDSLSRKFSFNPITSKIISNSGMYPTSLSSGGEFNLTINGADYIHDGCDSRRLVFVLFNPASLRPVLNAITGQSGRYGSDAPCGAETENQFAFDYGSVASRKTIKDFMDSIPQGYFVVVKNATPNPTYFPSVYWPWAQDWVAADPVGNSLRDKLKNAGFADIDSFNRARVFTFAYKKNDNTNFSPIWVFSAGVFDKLSFEFNINGKQAQGSITSPVFGPSKKWNFLHWRGSSDENPTADSTNIGVYGINNAGISTLLKTITSAKDTALDFIDANQYPYLQLQMYNSDFVAATPYQLNYWRINGQQVAEGAVAPNILFTMKDTAQQGEVLDFKLAFKNISPTAFDSAMKFNFIITDNSNVPHTITLPKGKLLLAGDTLIVAYKIDTKNFVGNNTLFVDVNPNNNQPEQTHFNNVLYKNFYVKADNYNPLLDVTFDGVHILNKDIVAAKPHIFIKLKDQNMYLALNDTSLLKVQVRYPDNSLHNYIFGDTMRFNPANLANGENTASIDFMPYFPLDGEYELIVSGKNVVGNSAGAIAYHVLFEVINKPMISNLLNYPNPFTTSTAFVFTVTGSQVPQNIRIQILTITGKVVKEITKEDLGTIHIGRNITDYKWDGTDTYGQKLANGVYLYRVITNLNGQSLEKYKADGDNTDKYFTKGYGKMVILR